MVREVASASALRENGGRGCVNKRMCAVVVVVVDVEDGSPDKGMGTMARKQSGQCLLQLQQNGQQRPASEARASFMRHLSLLSATTVSPLHLSLHLLQ